MPTVKPAALPLGVRLANPLNVRDFNQPWDGMVGAESGFCKFSKPEYGVRAAGIILLGYQKRGKNTLRGIVATFAPPSENDTVQYLDNVSKWTGWKHDDPLDLFEGDCLCVLLKAMSRQEIGQGRFPDSVFAAGAKMALDKRRVKTKAETTKEAVGAVTGAAATVAPLQEALTALAPLQDAPGVKWLIVALAATLAGVGLYFILRSRK